MIKQNIRPPVLKKGDVVGIVTPASAIDKKAIEEALKVLETWGLEVILGARVYDVFNQYGGRDEDRLEDLNQMIENDKIKAIWCARGGYGCIRIAGQVNFKAFALHPKWLIGFSDITIFHSVLQEEHNIQTMHAMMPLNLIDLKNVKALEGIRDVLFGQNPKYSLKSNKLNKTGKANGILTGGNLSILYSLLGTKYDFDTAHKILFIEDVGEKYYHIDRMMQSMKLAGKLENLKGLIVGGMNEMTDSKQPFGKNPNEIIAETVEEYDYPVIFDFEAGHIDDNYPLILGADIRMEAEASESHIEFI